ncbi:MAG: glycosyltransferase [Polyangiaceae bacterium]
MSQTKKPLRIAHVLESFAIGGGERVALDIAAQQVRAGHTVWAVSLSAGPGALEREFVARGVQTATIPKARGVDPLLVGRLLVWFFGHGIDVVHAHNPLARIYASPAAGIVGAPFVATMHGEAPDRSRRMWLRRVAARLADAFVIVSPGLEEAARDGESAPPARIKLIENGVDAERFHGDVDDRAAVRAELGIGEDEWVIGTAARLAPEKHQSLLLRSAAPLLREGARLVIAGDGPERASLEALATELGVTDRVMFLGMVADVPRFLRALDVFALSSKREGLPVSVLEAMATSVPVVATAVGGVPTAIDDGETGILVPAGDPDALQSALELLFHDHDIARAMGARGREVAVERFSLQRMRDEYEHLYEDLLAA